MLFFVITKFFLSFFQKTFIFFVFYLLLHHISFKIIITVGPFAINNGIVRSYIIRVRAHNRNVR